MHDDELHTAFMNARSSERLQLLELLESKLDRLAADKTSHWINLRRPSVNETKPEKTQ
ncbi:hypothetical protein [Serratia ureilytica]|uniref:hypothetical protein n=1 Tax=Serratia ureilytica TaxID=300181 RepID=UPI001F2A6C67|nr:hypothetical protein [Serratia ureilytica]